MRCRPSDVFAVLSDGWSYGQWVVGAVRVRDVEVGWPAAGTRIHHSVGLWPALINDTTDSKGAEPPRSLRLRVRAWPTGEAEVVFRVEPDNEGCVVTIHEEAASGPAKMIPKAVQEATLKWRNTETLRRLALIAEGRGRP